MANPSVIIDHVVLDRKQRSNIPSLVCAFMASLTTGGTTYAFGLYGDALKKTLALSQSQLDTISTSFFFAGLFSWIPGLCADRFGTRFSLSLGGMTGCASLMLYWGVARQFLLVPHDWLVVSLSLLGISIFLSCALVTGSVFKIIVASCGAGTKGSAVGVAKGYVGLGAGAYACLFEAIRTPGQSDLDFLPMAAFFFCCCATLPALILLPSKRQVDTSTNVDDATPLHFRTLFGSLICMAVLIIGNSLSRLMDASTAAASHRMSPNYGMSFLLMGIWLAPVVSLIYLPRRQHALNSGVTVSEEHELDETQESRINDDEKTEQERSIACLSLENMDVPKDEGEDTKKTATDEDEEQSLLRASIEGDEDGEAQQESGGVLDRNLMQMLQTPSALLMLWTTTILVGAGTVETNNMGQMVESLGFADSVTPAALALFSVAQSGSRVITGALSESALNWNTRSCCIDNGVPRPFFLVLASILAFFAHAILSVATGEAAFVLGVALAGAAFGMVWPLLVLIVGEIFGTANVGANYMFFDGFTSAAGTLFLSKLVAGEIYEYHIDANAKDKLTCMGTACFRQTQVIITLLSLTCVGTSLVLQFMSRRVYNRSNLHTM
jgi:hypothetical protein